MPDWNRYWICIGDGQRDSPLEAVARNPKGAIILRPA